jgi:hypothetical protein
MAGFTHRRHSGDTIVKQESAELIAEERQR